MNKYKEYNYLFGYQLTLEMIEILKEKRSSEAYKILAKKYNTPEMNIRHSIRYFKDKTDMKHLSVNKFLYKVRDYEIL